MVDIIPWMGAQQSLSPSEASSRFGHESFMRTHASLCCSTHPRILPRIGVSRAWTIHLAIDNVNSHNNDTTAFWPCDHNRRHNRTAHNNTVIHKYAVVHSSTTTTPGTTPLSITFPCQLFHPFLQKHITPTRPRSYNICNNNISAIFISR